MPDLFDPVAVRAAYDEVAVDYAAHFAGELAAKPLARAMLAVFAERVLALGGGRGPVADVGCGPGHVTAHLRELGLDVFGIDLSPAMVAEASRRYPHVRFVVGSLTALDVPDGTLAGALAWYSTIHLAPATLPAAFAELRRALAPGGQLVVAFQVGDGASVREDAFGRRISLAFHRWQPDAIADLLAATGLVVDARLVRAPDDGERTPHAHLLAHRPPA
jgi:SAM-dependent methyltransferase